MQGYDRFKAQLSCCPKFTESNIRATRPGEVWVSDITYVRTRIGWLYLTVIIDLYDRKVIGWSMSNDFPRGDDHSSLVHGYMEPANYPGVDFPFGSGNSIRL